MSEGPGPGGTRLSRWVVLVAIFGAMLALDQWTKFLAVERLTYAFDRAGATTAGEKLSTFWRATHLEPLARRPYAVWRPVWRMNYVENPGSAFGLLRDLGERARNVLFSLVYPAAAAFILHSYRKLGDRQRFLQVALAFVLSGAVGNFVDRLVHGYVIDFVEWYWWNRPDIRWPTFNVADSLIVVGVGMLLAHPGEKAAAPGRGAGKN